MDDTDVDFDSEFDDGEEEYEGSDRVCVANMTEAERRAHHNKLERQRRDQIKSNFSCLRKAVAILNGEKASRARILQAAAEYIVEIEASTRADIEKTQQMREENRLLEQQVNATLREMGMTRTDLSPYLMIAEETGRGYTDSSDDDEVDLVHDPEAQLRTLSTTTCIATVLNRAPAASSKRRTAPSSTDFKSCKRLKLTF